MAVTHSTDFRPLPKNFLDKNWKEGFGVFYKGGKESNAKYLKFLDFDPSDYSHLYKIMKEKGHEKFYIHEEELFNYHRNCLVKNLKLSILQDSPSTVEICKRAAVVDAAAL